MTVNEVAKRLRDRAGTLDEYNWHTTVELDGAKEIERLQALADNAYAERNKAVAGLAALAMRLGYRVGIKLTEIEGWDPAWHNCVYMDLPTGQVSWHYHDREGHLFDFLPRYAGTWDGHDTEEKYKRLLKLRDLEAQS